MNVIVSQYGARRRYLVPRVLYEKGYLQYLYTDSHSNSILGKCMHLFAKIGYNKVAISRLLKRKTNIPQNKVKAYDMLQVKLLLNRILKRSNSVTINDIFEGSAKQFIRWGVKDTDWLYTMFIENIEFTRYAKEHGVKILADIYENPYIFKELYDDVKTIPEYRNIQEYGKEQLDQYNLRVKYIDELLDLADVYLIPSKYVANALSVSKSFDENKVKIVPYASSVQCAQYMNCPRKGRIIWIGNDPVRKGLVYALRAYKDLISKYNDLEFRVIGPVPESIKNTPDFSDFDFVGYLGKEDLIKEFCNADIFVFPTLSEGFAGVLLEAASYGVPIITTRASGFDETFPGIFINEKSVDDIIVAVSRLLDDRNLREKMSHEMFAYSQSFKASVFANNLYEILENGK